MLGGDDQNQNKFAPTLGIISTVYVGIQYLPQMKYLIIVNFGNKNQTMHHGRGGY